MRRQTVRPVFFVGAPRSGTTIAFESFARHPALGMRLNYHARFPGLPAVGALLPLFHNRWWSALGRKRQYGGALQPRRLLPRPVEDYAFWERVTDVEFSRSFLMGKRASSETVLRVRAACERMLRFERRDRLACKLTGPPRFEYLTSIFPDAYFIHVVRDGRAVVESLLRVRFWREGGGLKAPWWRGGLSEADLESWEASGRDPAVLAALQWRAIMAAVRLERGLVGTDRYLKIRYEDLVADPEDVVRRLHMFCDLSVLDVGGRVREAPVFRKMNRRFRENLSPACLERVTAIMRSELKRQGYEVE